MLASINFNLYMTLDAETHFNIFMLLFPHNVSDINFGPFLNNEGNGIRVIDGSTLHNEIFLPPILSPVVLHIHPKLILVPQHPHKFYSFRFNGDVRADIEPLHQQVPLQREQVLAEDRFGDPLKFRHIVDVVHKGLDHKPQLGVLEGRLDEDLGLVVGLGRGLDFLGLHRFHIAECFVCA
jgi:hypothetical protein